MTTRKKKSESTISDHLQSIVYGKIPPQAKDLECAVLGVLILESSALDRVTDILREGMFYVEAHNRIYSAIVALSAGGKRMDEFLLVEELRRREDLEAVGGAYYLTILTNDVVSSANIESHARIIYEKWLLREQIRIGGRLLAAAYEDATDPFENMEQHEQELQAITTNNAGVVRHISTVMIERIKRLDELQKQDRHVTGIPSGFRSLDQVTHGWQKTDLIILAARPAVGKTAFALNLAVNAVNSAASGKPTGALIFSLEMSAGQLVDRILSAHSEVWLEKFKTGQMTEEVLKHQIFGRTVQVFADAPIFIDDTPALNVYQLRSRARSVVRKHPNIHEWIIIIDYLQLMSGVDDRGRGMNREQEISNISRNLKTLAKELNVPIIALSQLSRAVEQRSSRDGSKVPQLSDLRESGAIEQDADMVMFLYRPEYYETGDNMGESPKGLTEISIAKHRNGSLATGPNAIKLRAQLEIQKFSEWTNELPFISPPANLHRVFESSASKKNEDDELPF